MSKYQHLGGMFWKSNDGVFCEWKRLKLDPRQTVVHFDAWASDGKRVYWNSFQLRKIDALSFVALNGWYAKDAAAGYCGFSTTLKGAEVNSLEVLDSGREHRMFGLGAHLDAGYARDNKQVFFDGFLVNNAEPAGFVSLGNRYGRDATSVYFTRYRLNGAVPLRWRYLGGEYSRDDQRVFYENRIVKNARLEHFVQIKPFDSEFAYDGQTIFYRGEPTTTDYYVECLRIGAECNTKFADLVESGTWQRNFHEGEWHFRAPDELIQAFREVKLGNSIGSIERTIGNGTPVQREDWEYFFPPLDQMIRPGFREGAGTVSWSGDNTRTPAGCQVLRWNHPECVLACSFVDDKAVAKVLLDSNHVAK